MIQRYEREMSISHKDFYRLLPMALKNIDYEIMHPGTGLSSPSASGDRLKPVPNTYDDIKINGCYAGGNIQIIPGSEHKRKIASLELPVLYLVFIFTDISSEDILQFFTDFSRAYQRGGG
jgi:hypothetical protein